MVRTPSKSHLSLKATPKLSAVCPALHREGRRRGKRRTDVSAESLCSEYLEGSPSGDVGSRVCEPADSRHRCLI